MSTYTVNGREFELKHYGVKGMKWGKRKARYEARTTRKFSRVGRRLGEAEYERTRGAEEYKKHNDMANVFDKAAKSYESKGNYFKAEASRRAAEAIRARGENIKRSRDEGAAFLEKRAAKLQEKASAYAHKKQVDLGKKKIDSLLSEGKKKGFESAKNTEEVRREWELEEKLGPQGYAAYNQIRGR